MFVIAPVAGSGWVHENRTVTGPGAPNPGPPHHPISSLSFTAILSSSTSFALITFTLLFQHVFSPYELAVGIAELWRR